MILRARRALAADSSACPSVRCDFCQPGEGATQHRRAAQALSRFDDRRVHWHGSRLIPEGRRGVSKEEQRLRLPTQDA